MTEPLSRNNRVAGAIKAAATKGHEELSRAGSEAAWTKANCINGSRDVARNPYSRQNFYPCGHPLHPRSRNATLPATTMSDDGSA
jgi:hypothetical protein